MNRTRNLRIRNPLLSPIELQARLEISRLFGFSCRLLIGLCHICAIGRPRTGQALNLIPFVTVGRVAVALGALDALMPHQRLDRDRIRPLVGQTGSVEMPEIVWVQVGYPRLAQGGIERGADRLALLPVLAGKNIPGSPALVQAVKEIEDQVGNRQDPRHVVLAVPDQEVTVRPIDIGPNEIEDFTATQTHIGRDKDDPTEIDGRRAD